MTPETLTDQLQALHGLAVDAGLRDAAAWLQTQLNGRSRLATGVIVEYHCPNPGRCSRVVPWPVEVDYKTADPFDRWDADCPQCGARGVAVWCRNERGDDGQAEHGGA